MISLRRYNSTKSRHNLFALSPAYTNLLQAQNTLSAITKAAFALKDTQSWQDVVANEELVKATCSVHSQNLGRLGETIAKSE
jgi:hypothetical protein